MEERRQIGEGTEETEGKRFAADDIPQLAAPPSSARLSAATFRAFWEQREIDLEWERGQRLYGGVSRFKVARRRSEDGTKETLGCCTEDEAKVFEDQFMENLWPYQADTKMQFSFAFSVVQRKDQTKFLTGHDVAETTSCC